MRGLTGFVCELFLSQARINMIHVPYQGGAPAATPACAS
jgi:hypothetical protein